MAESMSGGSYREIPISASLGTRWKEINVNTGASASTLQDIKVADSCGGYSYQDSGKSQSLVRNRFIYWKTSKDELELVEQSLDYDLIGSRVVFRFQDTQILDGISITELHGSVVILVATVASVHRLIFPHPLKMQRNEMSYNLSDQHVPSIFLNSSVVMATSPKNKHMVNPAATMTSQLSCAATFLKSDGEALFAFSCNTGSLLLIKLPAVDLEGGVVQQFELTQSSMMKKLWSGIMRSNQDCGEVPTSIVILPFRGEAYIFTLCRDYKLRVWSTNTNECVLIVNMLDFCPGMAQTHPSPCSEHILRQVLSSDAGNIRICAYLNFPTTKQFCYLEPHLEGGRLQIYHINTVKGTEDDLIDYCATDGHLMTLWTDRTGESRARIRDLHSTDWIDVILQASEGEELLVPSHRDPREVYIEHIFHPGRFNLQDIQKALNVCRRSLDNISMFDNLAQVNTLKEEVTLAVEDAIKAAAAANELAEEDYYQLQLDQWSKFYSCCTQYQEVGARMMGVFADPVTGMICFIKKGGISYARPCDRIEEMFMGTGSWLNDQEETDFEDLTLKHDVGSLSMCLRLIEGKLTDEITTQFEYQISLKEDIRSLAAQIVDELFLNSSFDSQTEADSIGAMLQTIENLVPTLKNVLQTLEIQQNPDDDFMMDDSEVNANHLMSCERLFISSGGVEVLSKSLQQIADTRVVVVRDILILMVTALKIGDKCDLVQADADEISNELIPQICLLMHSYITLKWTTETVATNTQTSSMESNMRQLASLEITGGRGIGSSYKGGGQNMTITEMFLKGDGGNQARALLANTRCMEEETCATWTIGVLGLAKYTAQLLWPTNETFVFPEFLMGSCQYLPLQQYANQLSSWCEMNHASYRFMLGMAYLHFDEPQKAAQCFSEAREGVTKEPFLRQKILQTDETQDRKLEVLYYLKVLKQFEEFGAPDVVVAFAKTAIGVADDDDPDVATLWSKVFKYELELKHNEEAYEAMVANPDPSRKKDCLRQLLVTLSERGDLQAIVSFPYEELEDEVVSILESRARSVDLTTQNYYDLLYAFHINRHNFKKAGSVMYEHGMRLSRECPGRHGLERQAQCYLAAMNALRLVDPNYAWIVKPVPLSKPKNFPDDLVSSSAKRLYDGNQKSEMVQQKLEIIELSDIEKDFMLVDARLRLYAKESDQSWNPGPTSESDEIVGQLVNVGLYDRAVIICQLFNLKLNTVMESLALRCVNLARSHIYSTTDTTSYDWLQDNTLTLSNIPQNSSAADFAWTLLQNYLERYEEKPAQYHKCVAIKLLSHGFPLPTWLVNSYKKLNWSQLLKIYNDFDLLEDGVFLTMEYIDAVMDSFIGQESLKFNLKGCVKHSTGTAWLPYTYIDQLMLGLKDHKHEGIHELYDTLQAKVHKYVSKVEEISETIYQNNGQLGLT